MSAVIRANFGFSVETDKPAAVPDGEYKAVFVSYRVYRYLGKQHKLELRLQIIDPAEWMGQFVSRYYNVKSTNARGGFKASWRTDFVREYSLCFGAPNRLDKIAMTKFKKAILRIRTKTVKSDYKGRLIVNGLEYSVVAEVQGVTTL